MVRPISWKHGDVGRTDMIPFYRLCNGDQIPEDKRMFLLLQALGSEAVSIYYDMDFDKEEDKMSHDAILSRFDSWWRGTISIKLPGTLGNPRVTSWIMLSGPPGIASSVIKPLTWFETSSFWTIRTKLSNNEWWGRRIFLWTTWWN